MKTKHPIGPKKKHYQDKKRLLNQQHDENLVTPPNKSRRCNETSDVTALKDKINTPGRRNIINDTNQFLVEVIAELGSIATVVLLLTKDVDLMQSVHGNRHAVKQLLINLINHHIVLDEVTAPPLAPLETVPVSYDKIYFNVTN